MLRPCRGNWVTAIDSAGSRINGSLACTPLAPKPNNPPTLTDKTSSTALTAVRQRPHPLRNMKNAFLEFRVNRRFFFGLTLNFKKGSLPHAGEKCKCCLLYTSDA